VSRVASVIPPPRRGGWPGSWHTRSSTNAGKRRGGEAAKTQGAGTGRVTWSCRQKKDEGRQKIDRRTGAPASSRGRREKREPKKTGYLLETDEEHRTGPRCVSHVRTTAIRSRRPSTRLIPGTIKERAWTRKREDTNNPRAHRTQLVLGRP